MQSQEPDRERDLRTDIKRSGKEDDVGMRAGLSHQTQPQSVCFFAKGQCFDTICNNVRKMYNFD